MWDNIPWVVDTATGLALRDSDNNGYDDAAPHRRRWLGSDYDNFYEYPLATHEPSLLLKVQLTSANLTNTNYVSEQLALADAMTYVPHIAALQSLLSGYQDYLYLAVQRTAVEADLLNIPSMHWYYHARQVHVQAIVDQVQAVYDAVLANPPETLNNLVAAFQARAVQIRVQYALSDVSRVTSRGVAAGNSWNTELANGDADGNILFPWSQAIADNFTGIEYFQNWFFLSYIVCKRDQIFDGSFFQ